MVNLMSLHLDTKLKLSFMNFEKLVDAAAKVRVTKSVESFTLNYPDICEIDLAHQCLQYLPVTLKLLLESIIIGKDSELKFASIGQAIMQAVRPCILLAPLQ